MLNIKISRHCFVCHYPWNVLAKFHENPLDLHTLYKFAQSGGTPPKIKCDILARKGTLTTRATPGDYLAL